MAKLINFVQYKRIKTGQLLTLSGLISNTLTLPTQGSTLFSLAKTQSGVGVQVAQLIGKL